MTNNSKAPVAEAHDGLEGIFYLLDHMCKTFERINDNLTGISLELDRINDNLEARQ